VTWPPLKQAMQYQRSTHIRENTPRVFSRIIASGCCAALVSEESGQLTGFLIATLTGAPPVYDPGGATCQIDDFVVAPDARWQSTGNRLLRAGLAEAGLRGAVQAVVVTGHLDQPKRRLLRACGLEPASEWWVTPQPLPQTRPNTNSQ
jgi:GNAT superfamily N-acetyltransferase